MPKIPFLDENLQSDDRTVNALGGVDGDMTASAGQVKPPVPSDKQIAALISAAQKWRSYWLVPVIYDGDMISDADEELAAVIDSLYERSTAEQLSDLAMYLDGLDGTDLHPVHLNTITGQVRNLLESCDHSGVS